MQGVPSTDSPESVLSQALAWCDEGAGTALVTVLRTWSNAPRRAGSQMAVNAAGAWVGSVAGGLVESRLVATARQVIGDGQVRSTSLTVDDGLAASAGLACGGELLLRIEALGADAPGTTLLRQTLHAVQRRRGVVLCTRLSDQRQMLIAVDDPADTELSVEALRAAAADTSWIAPIEGDPVLFQVFNPALRLYLVGAIHIAQALVPAASLVGFRVTVIDPRPGFASSERFPGAEVVTGEVGLALRVASLDSRCAVIALSHKPEIDDPALIKALRSRAFYVGALGSRKTHKARLERLHAATLAPRLTERLHGPAGLAIGASSPAEIAAAIVAEMISVLRGRHERSSLQLVAQRDAAS